MVKCRELKWREWKCSELRWNEDFCLNVCINIVLQLCSSVCVFSVQYVVLLLFAAICYFIYSYVAVCMFCAVRCVIIICCYLLLYNFSTVVSF